MPRTVMEVRFLHHPASITVHHLGWIAPTSNGIALSSIMAMSCTYLVQRVHGIDSR